MNIDGIRNAVSKIRQRRDTEQRAADPFPGHDLFFWGGFATAKAWLERRGYADLVEALAAGETGYAIDHCAMRWWLRVNNFLDAAEAVDAEAAIPPALLPITQSQALINWCHEYRDYRDTERGVPIDIQETFRRLEGAAYSGAPESLTPSYIAEVRDAVRRLREATRGESLIYRRQMHESYMLPPGMSTDWRDQWNVRYDRSKKPPLTWVEFLLPRVKEILAWLKSGESVDRDRFLRRFYAEITAAMDGTDAAT